MAHKILDDPEYLEEVTEYIRKLKDEKEKKITELTIKSVESENTEEKLKPIRNLIQKAKADENPLRIEKYASDVVLAENEEHMRLNQEIDHLIGQVHHLDYLEREIIKKRTVVSTKSFSNKGRSDENE